MVNCCSACSVNMRCQIFSRPARFSPRQASRSFTNSIASGKSGASPDLPAVSRNWPNFGHCNWIWLTGASSSGLVSAVGKPLSRPLHTDIMASPENTRLRSASRCEGLLKSLMPTSFQVSRISSRMSVCSVDSPAVSTMISSARPSDKRRMPSDPLFRPISSSRRLAALMSNWVHALWCSRRYKGLSDTTVLLLGEARPKNSTWLTCARSIAIDNARRNRTSRNNWRQTGSLAFRLGYSAKCDPWPVRHNRVR